MQEYKIYIIFNGLSLANYLSMCFRAKQFTEQEKKQKNDQIPPLENLTFVKNLF